MSAAVPTPSVPVVDGLGSSQMLVQQCAYLLPALDAALQQKPSLSLLDVGCSSGVLTLDLARHVAAHSGGGVVVGLDISGAMLATARARAEYQRVDNVRFATGDACALPFAAATFDVVHVHQVLAHLIDPVRAIREMLRVLKSPGGLVFLREGDLEGVHIWGSGSGMLEGECFEVIRRVHRAVSSGSTAAGRDLARWAHEAGVEEGKIQAAYGGRGACATLEERRAYGSHWPARCVQGKFAEEAMKLGVSEARLQEFALAWKQWIDCRDSRLEMMQGEVIIRM